MIKSSDREPFFVFYDPAQRAGENDSAEQSLWRQYENVSESFFTEVNFFEVQDEKLLPDAIQRKGNETTILAVKDMNNFVSFDDQSKGKTKLFLKVLERQV